MPPVACEAALQCRIFCDHKEPHEPKRFQCDQACLKPDGVPGSRCVEAAP